MIRSSKAAVDLIVEQEVSSRAVYEKRYQRPEWPGGASGITVGVGYDLGYSDAQTVLADWKDYLPPDVVRAMQSFVGLKGQDAKAKLVAARALIIVPWDAAYAVFIGHDMPKWEGAVLKACPGSEQLPAGCFGVITSIAYNRGANFTATGDRYVEMRNIRKAIVTGTWDQIPAEIVAMKRLWPNVSGLLNRRDAEAALFKASLNASAPLTNEVPSGRLDTGDKGAEADVTPEGKTEEPIEKPLNVQTPKAAYSVEVETIQRLLTALRYYGVGTIDGLSGGKLKGSIAAFMNDRGKPAYGEITDDFKKELDKALKEGWTRPIAPSRANATTTDIAPKVGSVNPVWYQKIFAFLLGVPSALIAGFKAVFGEQASPIAYVQTVKEFFAAIPPEFYYMIVAGLALAIFVQAKKAQDATVKAFQEGKIN